MTFRTVFPSISPAARLRGGLPLALERSVNYTAGVVFDTGPFTLTADYFRIEVSDRPTSQECAAVADGSIRSRPAKPRCGAARSRCRSLL